MLGRFGALPVLVNKAGAWSIGDGADSSAKAGLHARTKATAAQFAATGTRVLDSMELWGVTDAPVDVAPRLRRFGAAGPPAVTDDTARAVFFCASDLSMFMTRSPSRSTVEH